MPWGASATSCISFEGCSQACLGNVECAAFAWSARPSQIGNGCADGQPRCVQYLGREVVATKTRANEEYMLGYSCYARDAEAKLGEALQGLHDRALETLEAPLSTQAPSTSARHLVAPPRSPAPAAPEEAPRFIRWRRHPHLCVDVWGDHAGAMVQLWTCADLEGAGVREEVELKWLLPPVTKPGQIRWAGNSSYCLNTPSDNRLQLWYCNTAPEKHTFWTVTPDGRIHLSYDFSKCLDIPNGEQHAANGIKLQLWDCMNNDPVKSGNVLFEPASELAQ